jgi:hypothetical protein
VFTGSATSGTSGVSGGSARQYDVNWANVGGPGAAFFSSGKSWLQVFNTPPAGNAYYNLAHQYMAAKLNVLSGSSAPAAVATAIAWAEAFFAGRNPAIKLTNAQKNEALQRPRRLTITTTA